MSHVWFFEYSQGKNALDGIQSLLSKSGFESMIPKGEAAAIKLHMGELGNIRYTRPVFARKLVDIVRSKGGKPFLIDTIAAYPGQRATKEKYLNTAAMHGFVEASMNAPVMITDDEDGQQVIPVTNRVDECQLTEAKVPDLLINTGCIIVLSHVKGHVQAGFGGAIKNLAMGCVSTETKRAQHVVNMPQFDEEGDCDGCGKCVDSCPTEALALVNGKPERTVAECTYCSSCFFACPSGCWVWPPRAKEKLQVYLAHSANAVVSGYRGKIAFVNLIQDVVPECDCMPASGEPVVQDVGITFSFDPVAIDKASLDLIDRAPVVPGPTQATPPDLLGKINGTSCSVQLTTAEKLGMGSLQYEIILV